jgi:hypothetical protein
MRVESRRLRSLNVFGPTETGKRENRYIATIRQLPKPSQELEAVHSGHRNVRNHSVEFIFGNNAHTVCTGYRAARRDHPPGGRLERHSGFRVDGAAGGATWLLCCRSQKLIRAAHDGGTCRIKQLQRTVERPRERGARPLNCGVRWLRVYESKV